MERYLVDFVFLKSFENMSFLHYAIFAGVIVLLDILWKSSPEVLSDDYECFHFPEPSPVSSDGYDHFDSKTAYLTARDTLHKLFNATFPLDRSQCTPVYFHYLSRHAIRYPMLKEIKGYDPQMIQLQQHFLRSGKLSASLQNEFATWRSLWHRSEAEHISQSGHYETAIQARIFYRYFPTLLNLNNTDFEVGVTPKIRTVETAQAFIRSLVEFQLRNEHSTFEESNAQVKEIMNAKFPMAKYDRVLYSFKKCKFPKPKQYDILRATPTFQALVSEFAKRYNLDPASTKFETLWYIYQVCRYEVALFRHSPWCKLLSLNEIKAIQYSEDVKEYYKTSGPISQLFCTVMEDLVNRVQAIIDQGAPVNGRTKATLYFSHNEMFRLLSPFMHLFERFPDYVQNGQRICVPKERDYRASYILPFGANFAAVLHRCNNQYKLLMLLNEIPVMIPGCSSALCDVEQFFQYYRNYPCDLDKICSMKNQ